MAGLNPRKRGLGVDVLTAAQQRIAKVFDDFPRISVSFSGGKDSTVMLHLAMDEARKRNRTVAVLFVDLEGQYRLTIDHIARCYDLYAEHIEPYWLALPLNLRNAVSVYEPQWLAWDPDKRQDWIREPHPMSTTDEDRFPWFRRGMEFEELVPEFNRWYAQGQLMASLVGIRSDESLNRWRTISSQTKSRYEGLAWTTWSGGGTYGIYPIYDWRTEDVWTYHARYPDQPHNSLYDLMHRAGLTIHQQRICQPYGDDQRKGLWLFHIIEPDTWGKVVARVNGANQGAIYAQESGNILGQRKITRPEGHTWESFARMLLGSLPETTAEHYRNKIAVFLRWWIDRGYPNGIPDEMDAKAEAARDVPSWRRICKALLRNDYWCKGLSFSQHKSEAYDRYTKIMKKRRQEWGLI